MGVKDEDVENVDTCGNVRVELGGWSVEVETDCDGGVDVNGEVITTGLKIVNMVPGSTDRLSKLVSITDLQISGLNWGTNSGDRILDAGIWALPFLTTFKFFGTITDPVIFENPVVISRRLRTLELWDNAPYFSFPQDLSNVGLETFVLDGWPSMSHFWMDDQFQEIEGFYDPTTPFAQSLKRFSVRNSLMFEIPTMVGPPVFTQVEYVEIWNVDNTGPVKGDEAMCRVPDCVVDSSISIVPGDLGEACTCVHV